jgi:type IV secretory pathway VirB6-like protein
VNVNWTLFANLYNGIITPVIAQMQAMLGSVCITMQPVVLAMVTLWLGFVAFDIANGTKTVQQAMRDFFIAGMVIGALQTAQYTQYISDFFLQAVPNTIGTALGGQTSPVAGLDTVLDTAIAAASKVYEALPPYALKTIPLGLGVIVFIVLALASVGFAFAVYMIAAIINVAAIVIGPVFLALAAIPITRRFAAGWFGVLVSGCATQLIALAVIQLLSGGETSMIQQTVGTAATSNSNSLAMLWGLAQCGILLALCSAVVKKIPDIAREIAGGVYHGTASIHAATFGAAAAAAGASVGAARGAAGAIGTRASRQIGAGAVRVSTPVGPSLSRKS